MGLAFVSLVFLPALSLAQTPEPGEVIRVDSDLVDLKVSVLRLNTLSPVTEYASIFWFWKTASRKRFLFSRREAPFDLVLLLDLSGHSEEAEAGTKFGAPLC